MFDQKDLLHGKKVTDHKLYYCHSAFCHNIGGVKIIKLKVYGKLCLIPKTLCRTYTLSGNYRKVLRMVNNLSWYILQYNDPNDNLIRSDFEEILGHREPENISG